MQHLPFCHLSCVSDRLVSRESAVRLAAWADGWLLLPLVTLPDLLSDDNHARRSRRIPHVRLPMVTDTPV